MELEDITGAECASHEIHYATYKQYAYNKSLWALSVKMHAAPFQPPAKVPIVTLLIVAHQEKTAQKQL
ncbi:hypothetical protein CCR75_002532 [Bremia lactucae]|uniref:Uncharacterized protein n=1 Tax=Bremia lactucae TaxID=4779 RepID=A0A976IJ70_BRELC|nr:hypothetical protein CCR75_002532 [Bremia lactucae]